MSFDAFQTKEIEIGNTMYSLRKFRALDGLRIRKHIAECGLISEDGIDVVKLEPEMIMQMIIKGCTKGSIELSDKKFDIEFAGKYMEMYQLVAEILMFNYFDPNVETASE